ncbi:MAG: single-stranded-DNA-specific exonuclease RecJ [Bacteroidales bacterium]|nr:single-stranded-DNA-specific exonuclease RecJ [Bacteroidales bacterium]
MKEKRWILQDNYDLDVVERLSNELNVDKIIATLLVERGITTFEQAKMFFRPNLDHLHDPFLMQDMDRAILRINKAIEENERILVYGDYDVDGTTAVSLVYTYLFSFYKNIDYYIPDRDTEGYGISFQGIDYASRNNITLVIALDCGIKALDQIGYANERGIDFIVADHHLPGEELPNAYAILDPKRVDCGYPYKELSGCGIGFKLVEAHLEQRRGVKISDDTASLSAEQVAIKENIKRELLPYLDLVAVSIAADIVPIMGENRVLAYYGLKVLNKRPRPGLEAILFYSNIMPRNPNTDTAISSDLYFCRELSVGDLVFSVGPRINAAGRIRSAVNSVKLLISKNIDEAKGIACEIDNYNKERKGLDTSATEEAKNSIDNDINQRNKKSIVLFNKHWHKGVVGIVASRLVETYYKPTIIFTESNGLMTGSARSIKDFDIHTAIESCSDLLEHFGGHKYAAGLSLKPENFDAFVQKFEKVVDKTLREDQMIPEIEIDAVLKFSENLTPKFLRILKQFSPFGPENMTPVFQSNNLVDTGFAKIVGTNHLKFCVAELDKRSDFISSIGFSMGKHYERMKKGHHFDICYHFEENYWNGKVETQLNVKDIRFEQ